MNLKDNVTNINDINQEIIDLLGKDYLKKVLKTDYNRFRQELTTLNKNNTKCVLFLEDANYDENIRNGNFRAQYDKETLYKRFNCRSLS